MYEYVYSFCKESGIVQPYSKHKALFSTITTKKLMNILPSTEAQESESLLPSVWRQEMDLQAGNPIAGLWPLWPQPDPLQELMISRLLCLYFVLGALCSPRPTPGRARRSYCVFVRGGCRWGLGGGGWVDKTRQMVGGRCRWNSSMGLRRKIACECAARAEEHAKICQRTKSTRPTSSKKTQMYSNKSNGGQPDFLKHVCTQGQMLTNTSTIWRVLCPLKMEFWVQLGTFKKIY